MRSRSRSIEFILGATASAIAAFSLPSTTFAADETANPVPAAAPTAPAASTPAAATPAATPATPAPASSAAAGDAAAKPADAAAATVPEKPKPLPPTLVARINLTSQTMVVQAGSKVIHTWKVSSGAPGYATPPGSFKPTWMSKMHYSKQYDDAPMPHSVFFNGGIAVHGTQSVYNLGRAASHGCVRLAPANAARFYQLVSSHGAGRTQIIVHGRQPFSDQANRIAKLNQQGKKRNRQASQTAGWTIAPAQAGNYGYRQPNTTARRGNVYAYNTPSQQRRPTPVRVQSTYWGGF